MDGGPRERLEGTGGRTGPWTTAFAQVDSTAEALLEASDGPSFAWAAPGGEAVAGAGVADRWVAAGPTRFEDSRRQGAELLSRIDHTGPSVARPRALGGLAFHERAELEPPWAGFRSAQFVIPAVQLVEHEGTRWLTALGRTERAAARTLETWTDRLSRVGPVAPPPAVVETRRSVTEEAWTDQVETALDSIDRRALEKVVIAGGRTVSLAEDDAGVRVFSALGAHYPECYRFFVSPEGESTFLGATPERLVSVSGGRVETEALAGSAPRGDTPVEDDTHRDQLEARERDRREHGLVVDAIAERLRPLVDTVSIGPREVRRLATVQHLRTPITGTLEGDLHVLDVAGALHPTPAVGGYPRAAALEAIAELESIDRGWYAAPIGWFDAAGDGAFAVGIRAGLLDGRDLHLFAGNGIVAGCDPATEWDELELKFDAFLEVLE